MAKRQSLGRGLSALIPDVSRETSADPNAVPTPGTPSTSAADAGATSATKSGGNQGGKATAKPAKSNKSSTTSGSTTATSQTSSAAPFEVAGLTLMELPIRQIVPNAAQPRKHFDEEALTELVHSITEVGLLQPIVVRPTDTGYELIAGERRLRASKKAGLKTIPALVRQTADEQMLRDALLENLHRSQLTPLEEAAAYHQLLEDFGCTQEELATRLGRSRPQISNTLRLLNLPASVQRRVAAGVLSAGHARALLGLKDAAAIEKLATRIVAEGLSVRSVEEIVSVGLADKPKAAKTSKAKGTLSAPGLAELGERMSARLDTRVTVAVGQKRGKVIIEFATLEDLRRIVEIVDPPTRGMFGEPLL
jgi:ParB family transcriptional regulator, chromosome partitioning protein